VGHHANPHFLPTMSTLVTNPDYTPKKRPPAKGGFGFTSQERRRRWRTLKRVGTALLLKFRVASTLNPRAPPFIPGKSEKRRGKEKKVKRPKAARTTFSLPDDDELTGVNRPDRIVVESTDVKAKRDEVDRNLPVPPPPQETVAERVARVRRERASRKAEEKVLNDPQRLGQRGGPSRCSCLEVGRQIVSGGHITCGRCGMTVSSRRETVKAAYAECETHVASLSGEFVVCRNCGKVLRKASS